MANIKPPKSEGEAPPGAESADTLRRITELEHEVKHLNKTISFVRGTNWFIIVVLFIAIIALVVTAIVGFSQNVKSNNANQLQIQESLQKLQFEYDNSGK